MDKPLNEMTNEELWQLFPIILKPHDPAWKKYYKEEKELLTASFDPEKIVRINHIGSTSVPGLMAKPSVDILLEVKENLDSAVIIKTMEQAGYLYTSQPDNPPPHMMFMKGYTPQGFAKKVFHVHVRYGGDWSELYFRDYLTEHPEQAAAYAELKRKLMEPFKHDRDGYTDAKTDFVRQVTGHARRAYGNRYRL